MKFRALYRPAASLIALLALTSWVAADAPPGPYFNGFEQNTAGWFNLSGATIQRQPSGYTNGGGYADGIPSAAGNYHARLGIDPNRTRVPREAAHSLSITGLTQIGVATARSFPLVDIRLASTSISTSRGQ